MADLDDDDLESGVVHRVDDAITSLPDPQPITMASKLLRTARARILRQSPDASHDALTLSL